MIFKLSLVFFISGDVSNEMLFSNGMSNDYIETGMSNDSRSQGSSNPAASVTHPARHIDEPMEGK